MNGIPAKIVHHWTRKTESYGADPYAKRTAGRVAAAPALQSNPVGPAPRTPQAHACRRLEYLHLAAPRTHRTNVRRRFRHALGRHRPAPHLNLLLSQLPCITKSTLTPSSRNRFTTICGSNIPNGSSQMASAPRVILTRRALWNCSALRRERDPTSLSPSSGHRTGSKLNRHRGGVMPLEPRVA
jgi:hypothetical protein